MSHPGLPPSRATQGSPLERAIRLQDLHPHKALIAPSTCAHSCAHVLQSPQSPPLAGSAVSRTCAHRHFGSSPDRLRSAIRKRNAPRARSVSTRPHALPGFNRASRDDLVPLQSNAARALPPTLTVPTSRDQPMRVKRECRCCACAAALVPDSRIANRIAGVFVGGVAPSRGRRANSCLSSTRR